MYPIEESDFGGDPVYFVDPGSFPGFLLPLADWV